MTEHTPDEVLTLIDGHEDTDHGKFRVVYVDSEIVGPSFFLENTINFEGDTKKIVTHLKEPQIDMLLGWLHGLLDKTVSPQLNLGDLEIQDHECDFDYDGGSYHCTVCGQVRIV